MQTISATQARQSFFDLLDQTRDQGRSFAIEKHGQVVAYLTLQKPTATRPNIMQFAGIWGKLTKKDQLAIDSIYHRRRSNAPTRLLPTI
ncbi:type II toxin-antitoxin system Phd/YefM family antitoxin [Candidatus Woesebacteria bacterium]|nr:type II toxin-antitoxin system Phd/YefM family antitoxin [Candidatus Woesebacteria bacterium]